MTNKKYLVQKNGKTIKCCSKYDVCTEYDIDRATFATMLDKGIQVNGITVDLKLDDIDYTDLM